MTSLSFRNGFHNPRYRWHLHFRSQAYRIEFVRKKILKLYKINDFRITEHTEDSNFSSFYNFFFYWFFFVNVYVDAAIPFPRIRCQKLKIAKSDLFCKNSTSWFFTQWIAHKDVLTFTKLHLRNLYPFKDNVYLL